MTIKFPCARCGQSNAAEHDWAGREVSCGRCGAPVTVPYPKPQVLDVPTPAAAVVAAPLLKFRCGQCATRNEAERSLAGQTVQCGSCGAWLLVPGGPPRAVPEPVPAPIPKPARRKRAPIDEFDDVDSRFQVPPPAPRYAARPAMRSAPQAEPGSEAPMGWIVFGVALFSILLGAIGVIVPGAGVVVGMLVVLIGLGFWMAGVIWTYVIAFKENTACGLLCMFIGIYGLYYRISRWPYTKQPLICWGGGFGIFLFGLVVFLMSTVRLAREQQGAVDPAIAEARAADRKANDEAFSEPGLLPRDVSRPSAAGTGSEATAAGAAVDLPDPPQEPDLSGLDQIESGRRLESHRAAVRAWLDDCWQRLRRTFGDGRVVTVTLRGIDDPEMQDQILERLRASLAAVGATAAVGKAYQDGVRAVAGPVADPQALAVRIDLGITVAVDINGRDMTLTIQRNPR